MKIPSAFLLLPLTFGAVLSTGRPAPGQVPPPGRVPAATAPASTVPAPAADDREADRAAIRQAAAEFVQAFERKDAAAVAAQWTEGGEFHSDQAPSLIGRAALAKSYAEAFKADPHARIEQDIASIRFPSRDSAVEEGVLRFLPGGSALPTSTRYSVVHVREGGRWLAAVGREWGGGVEKLSDLAWLVGTWKSAGKDHETETTFEWNDDKTLLRKRFVRKEAGKAVVVGSEGIAGDPRTGRLRARLTDDQGGRAESEWFRDGNRWVEAVRGTTDGDKPFAAFNILTRLGPNEILWRSVERTVDGKPVADSEPVKLTRVRTAQ